jgi:hypothetical protein
MIRKHSQNQRPPEPQPHGNSILAERLKEAFARQQSRSPELTTQGD